LREQESSLRLEIRQCHEGLSALLTRLQSRGPMIRGSVYRRKRKCGKPQCRCLRGRPHRDRVLAIRRSGRVVVRGLDAVGDAAIEEAVVSWRLFRRHRGELALVCRSLLEAVDRLGRQREIAPSKLHR
jgi:hypothetical protein